MAIAPEDLRVGQTWSYKTSWGDQVSLTLTRVEPVYVAYDCVRNGFRETHGIPIAHNKESFAASLTSLRAQLNSEEYE